MSSEAGTEDGYILNRDWRGIARLNYRYQLFNQVLGYLVYPSIDVPKDAKIAEIGAGTCIWSTELAQKLPPSVTIDALDISNQQYPPRDWVPKNVNLVVHDIYQPLPANMIGQYDLVRMQNWLCIWRDDTAELLVGNLIKMLKPGGYLQWCEQDPAVNRAFHSPNCSISDEGTKEMLRFMGTPREDINFKWVSNLGPIFSEHQLELITFDRKVISDANQVPWGINVLQTGEEYALNLKRNAKSQSETDAGDKLLMATEKASIELLNGVGMYQELVMAVGRKPLA